MRKGTHKGVYKSVSPRPKRVKGKRRLSHAQLETKIHFPSTTKTQSLHCRHALRYLDDTSEPYIADAENLRSYP
jgi:hypothetical protein